MSTFVWKTLSNGRRYKLFTPASSPPRCVVALHGGGLNANSMINNWNPVLDDSLPTRVAFPDGTSGSAQHKRSWNSGTIAVAGNPPPDDVAHLEAVLADVGTSENYMMGGSNGGMMAYRFAAERPELVEAIAAFSANVGGQFNSTHPLHVNAPPVGGAPVSILHAHGALDQNVKVNGGLSSNGARIDLPVIYGLELWRAHNDIVSELSQVMDLVHTSSQGLENKFIRHLVRSGQGHGWHPGNLGLMLTFFQDVFLASQ